MLRAFDLFVIWCLRFGNSFFGEFAVAKASSQKFIARNRAPRVQIEYDVEVYGSEKKVQLPFVMA